MISLKCQVINWNFASALSRIDPVYSSSTARIPISEPFNDYGRLTELFHISLVMNDIFILSGLHGLRLGRLLCD